MSTPGPAFSVIIPAYNARGRITRPLLSLRSQEDCDFEVIVVDSGPASCAAEALDVRPDVRVVRSDTRLGPGAARNRGLANARGEYIGFMSDDHAATARWLVDRLRCHKEGYPLVGGSISNGRPRNPIATAEYLLEYSALIPSREVLREQSIPHALSFSRSVFAALGGYPEDTLTGEDTLFNIRCLDAGLAVAFAPRASLAHFGSRRVSDMMKHAYNHGVGLAQCVSVHGLASDFDSAGDVRTVRCLGVGARYVLRGWFSKLARLRRTPRLLLPFLLLSPLIVSASAATAAGVCREQARGA